MDVPMELDPEHVAWSKRLWESLDEGQEWMIPRSGTRFRKEGDTLVHIGGFDTEGLFEAIQVGHHFAAFGVKLESRPELLPVEDDSPVPLDGTRRFS